MRRRFYRPYSPYEETTIPDRTVASASSQHTWPALLVLFFLAPFVAEGLSGSTPILTLLNPIVLLFQATLYGSGAILVRELVRRRGLGWENILLLGMAYGILEEGLVVTSWFNPYWPDLNFLGGYGRLLDTSWVWAVSLTIFHAVVSITIPIVLVELLFPKLADRPWLGKRSFRGYQILLAVVSLIGLIGFGFVAYRAKGYFHPPLMYFGAALMATGLVWLGLHFRPKPPAFDTTKNAPGLWRLRLIGLAGTFGFFFCEWVVPHFMPFPFVTILLFAGLVGTGVWFISHWAKRGDWGAEHCLALVTGALSFFVLLSPLIEFTVKPGIASGQVLYALLFLAGLAVLARVVRRRESATI